MLGQIQYENKLAISKKKFPDNERTRKGDEMTLSK